MDQERISYTKNCNAALRTAFGKDLEHLNTQHRLYGPDVPNKRWSTCLHVTRAKHVEYDSQNVGSVWHYTTICKQIKPQKQLKDADRQHGKNCMTSQSCHSLSNVY